jgi:hypothetical protein
MLSRMRHLNVVTILVFLIIAGSAHADSISFTLSPSSASGTPGNDLTFMGTLTNNTSTTIFLNGDSFTTSQSFLVVNDASFFQNAPLSLAPGQSTGPFVLFSVLIASASSPGIYGLNSFSILGGLDSSATITVATKQFNIVVKPLTTVPEPSYLPVLLLAFSYFLWKTRDLRQGILMIPSGKMAFH